MKSIALGHTARERGVEGALQSKAFVLSHHTIQYSLVPFSGSEARRKGFLKKDLGKLDGKVLKHEQAEVEQDGLGKYGGAPVSKVDYIH